MKDWFLYAFCFLIDRIALESPCTTMQVSGYLLNCSQYNRHGCFKRYGLGPVLWMGVHVPFELKLKQKTNLLGEAALLSCFRVVSSTCCRYWLKAGNKTGRTRSGISSLGHRGAITNAASEKRTFLKSLASMRRWSLNHIVRRSKRRRWKEEEKSATNKSALLLIAFLGGEIYFLFCTRTITM